jgi:hypothetical protein
MIQFRYKYHSKLIFFLLLNFIIPQVHFLKQENTLTNTLSTDIHNKMAIVDNWQFHLDNTIEFWNTEMVDAKLANSRDCVFIKSNAGRRSDNGRKAGPVIMYYGYMVTIVKYQVVDDGINLFTSDGYQLYAPRGLMKKNKTYIKRGYCEWSDETYEIPAKQKYEVHSDYDVALSVLKRWDVPSPVEIELCEGGFPVGSHKCSFRKRKGKTIWTCKLAD